ncbi:VirB4 family type IV secretion system protein [Salinibaculum rarum]|uniref:VirB4 family type IV secretion system protein n=1 Tax=Salinibaculum rarum TaxID=3058903 RepID=UPI00265DD253|nr:DUF87 domain-containing protein [Salinibaculum sp. KK48]
MPTKETCAEQHAQPVTSHTSIAAGGALIPLQISGPVKSAFEAIGMGSLVEQFGAIPMLGLTIGILVVVGGGGIVAFSSFRGESSSSSTSPDTTDSSPKTTNDSSITSKIPGVGGSNDDESPETTLATEDEDIVDEATERLRREGADITGKALQAKIEEIHQEQGADEREGKTGAIHSPEERGETARMAVAPEQIQETSTYIKRTGEQGTEKHARLMILSDYPSRVSYGWLDRLFTSGFETKDAEIRVSYHINPRDTDTMMQKLNVRATRLNSEIKRKREDGKVNTNEEEQQLQHVNRLREGLTEGSTKLFDFSLYLEVLAEDEETLNEATKELKQIVAQSNARATPFHDQQLRTMRAMAPTGQDRVRKTQIMDTRSLGTTFPFIEPSVVEPTGVLMGFHKTTNSPVVVDRFELSGHNMLVSGKIGSGKSYLSKLIMWRRLMMDPETEILIIDPVGGFADMVDAVEGQRITIDSDTIINPMEIKQVEDEEALEKMEGDPYDDKIRSVMGMFKAHFAGERNLEKEEEGVLRRAVRFAYLRQGITKDVSTHGNKSPTIDDVLDILQEIAHGNQPSEFLDVPPAFQAYIDNIETEAEAAVAQQNREREANYAHSVLLGLEDFQQGGQRANLNGETNVSLHARVVQFDLSNIADSNSELFMHIVLDWLFQRAKANRGRTLVTIDEAHYMLRQQQALDMLNLFARHSRHYDSGMTLISQTVDEFMKNPEAKEIYDQCDIRALMRHEDIGKEATKALGLSERERNFVMQAQAGNSADYSEGLVYIGNVGKMRLRVLSNQFEHHIIDEDVNAWAFLYDNDRIAWEDIPREEQPDVKAIMEEKYAGNDAAAD